MFKRVDTDVEDNIEGFSYRNLHNELEVVEFYEDNKIRILDAVYSDMNVIYMSDIPKLIKALEAAYKHLTEESK